VFVVYVTGELSRQDAEPTASTAGRFQLRPSTLDRYAASLFKGDIYVVELLLWGL